MNQLVAELKLAATHRMKVIAESTVKTDRIDARVIAVLFRVNYLPTCYVPPREARELRKILRQGSFVVQLMTKVNNRIHSLLDKPGVEHHFDDLFCGWGLSAGAGIVLKTSGGVHQNG
ncbi:MAG: transposase [Candidatus Saccharicenans sp.]|nr:transposase [Candidatus Saccharicenans sp.]